jgi:hypothetical protein
MLGPDAASVSVGRTAENVDDIAVFADEMVVLVDVCDC